MKLICMDQLDNDGLDESLTLYTTNKIQLHPSFLVHLFLCI